MAVNRSRRRLHYAIVIVLLALVVQTVYAAVFVNDTFTDTSGTALASHTSDDGKSWTKNGAAAAGGFVISNANRIRTNTTTTTVYYSSGTPASADYEVQAVIRRFSAVSDNYLGVGARWDTASLDGYIGYYQTTTNVWELGRYVGGAFSAVSPNGCNSAATLTTGQDYTLKLTVTNTTKSLYVDGALKCSISTNEITRVGKAAVFAISIGAAATDTTGMHLDTFCAGAAGDCAGGFPPPSKLPTLPLSGVGLPLISLYRWSGK